MSDDDLVSRLRSYRRDLNGAAAIAQSDDAARSGPIAADAIEAQEAEIERLREVVRQLAEETGVTVADGDGWYRIVDVDGTDEFVPFTEAQADAVRRALTTKGDTP